MNMESIKMGKQIQTERGLIYVEAEYQSVERAKMDGYSLSFHSEEYGDVYSKCTDELGHFHTFALIAGY